MSNPISDNYLVKLDKWMSRGGALRSVNMSEVQKLRTEIAYQAYQVWCQNKQIRPIELCRRIAMSTYEMLLRRAEIDPVAAERCKQLRITPGKQRTISELTNDVSTLDHIIATFTPSTANIERCKVEDASDWLIQNGMRTGDGRDVKNGADLKMKLYKDFDESKQGFGNLANTDIVISADVSVVKPGCENYTDEFKKKMAAQYGVSVKEVEDMYLNDEGQYESAPTDAPPEDDYFERVEGEME